jgi:hypothetical protein
MGIAGLLASWAATLNRLPPGNAATAATALGLAGLSIPPFGQYTVDPPPDGLTDVVIDERNGEVFTMRAAPVPGTLTRADLDAVLGPGHQLPRVHWNDPLPVAYLVEVLGEPFTCTVFAYFARTADPGDPVVSVMLRRDRSAHTFPGHHAVDDRPVRLERLPSGEIAALALDLRSGAFVRDDSYLGRIAGRPAGAEELPAASFDRLVAALRRAASNNRQVRPLTWHPTGNPEYSHRAELDGVTYLLSEGDFPVEARYTLVVDGQEVDHLDTWPSAWRRCV